MPVIREVIHRTHQTLETAGIPDARLEAEVLVMNVMRMTRQNIFAQQDNEVGPQYELDLAGMLERRRQREPLAYILGYREFYGINVMVTPSVMVPRPETENMVEHTLFMALMGMETRDLIIADVGTGEEHGARRGLVHPWGEIEDRRLAGSAGTDERDVLTGLGDERDAPEGRSILSRPGGAERHIAELDPTDRSRGIGDVDRIRRVDDRGCQIQVLEDAGEQRHRGLHIESNPHECHEREEQASLHGGEGHDRARRDVDTARDVVIATNAADRKFREAGVSDQNIKIFRQIAASVSGGT